MPQRAVSTCAVPNGSVRNEDGACWYGFRASVDGGCSARGHRVAHLRLLARVGMNWFGIAPPNFPIFRRAATQLPDNSWGYARFQEKP
jgi:hypothetical protein